MAEKWEDELGRRLRAIRIGQRLTQQELADRANVSLGAVKHLERASGSTTATLAKVLRALGRQDWLDSLAQPAVPFSPLELLEQRRRSARRGQGRVRHQKTAR